MDTDEEEQMRIKRDVMKRRNTVSLNTSWVAKLRRKLTVS